MTWFHNCIKPSDYLNSNRTQGGRGEKNHRNSGRSGNIYQLHGFWISHDLSVLFCLLFTAEMDPDDIYLVSVTPHAYITKRRSDFLD